MVYVITGATSFIGLELINYLHQNGEEVIAVCRSNSNKLSEIPVGVKIVHATMDEYAQLHEVIPQADIFINLAWEGTGHSGRDLTNIQKDNIKNTLEAMISSQKMGCKLFVESGSQAEYGSIETTIKEESACNPFSEYGKAKLEVLEKGRKLSQEIGIKYVHFRIFSIYGENDHPWTLFSTCIQKMLKNEEIELSSCTQHWNFLYVKDAVALIHKVSRKAYLENNFHSEIYNLASNDTRVLKDFVEDIKNTLKSKSNLKYGKIEVKNLVSLQPSIDKLLEMVGNFTFTPFNTIIKKLNDK